MVFSPGCRRTDLVRRHPISIPFHRPISSPSRSSQRPSGPTGTLEEDLVNTTKGRGSEQAKSRHNNRHNNRHNKGQDSQASKNSSSLLRILQRTYSQRRPNLALLTVIRSKAVISRTRTSERYDDRSEQRCPSNRPRSARPVRWNEPHDCIVAKPVKCLAVESWRFPRIPLFRVGGLRPGDSAADQTSIPKQKATRQG